MELEFIGRVHSTNRLISLCGYIYKMDYKYYISYVEPQYLITPNKKQYIILHTNNLQKKYKKMILENIEPFMEVDMNFNTVIFNNLEFYTKIYFK
jgi:hypothetical protein